MAARKSPTIDKLLESLDARIDALTAIRGLMAAFVSDFHLEQGAKPNGAGLPMPSQTLTAHRTLTDAHKAKLAKAHKTHWASMTAKQRQARLDQMLAGRRKARREWKAARA